MHGLCAKISSPDFAKEEDYPPASNAVACDLFVSFARLQKVLQCNRKFPPPAKDCHPDGLIARQDIDASD